MANWAVKYQQKKHEIFHGDPEYFELMEEWHMYLDGQLVGRVTKNSRSTESKIGFQADTEGDLPHRRLGVFRTLLEAKQAIAKEANAAFEPEDPPSE